MSAEIDPSTLEPEHCFDGGDLDCGSGLVLALRENMLKVAVGGVLEMRSLEPTVGDDLPPWCRMVGHEYLGSAPGELAGQQRYFVRRGSTPGAEREEQQVLAEDKRRASEYEWRLRARSSGHRETTIYCRNFSWKIGMPVSFDERDANPCALEHLLGALCGGLCTAFASECSRRSLEVDDVELSARVQLRDTMAHLGLEQGEPAIDAIELKCFASSFADEEELRAAWESTVARSPIARTLERSADLTLKFAIV